MIELESIQYNPEIIFKTILWIFTPLFTLVILDLFLGQIDDDDDPEGGVMSPVGVYQGA